MRGVAVQGPDDPGISHRPDEAARKRVAIELIRDHDRPLRWTARRYSICAEDAEDAYQRGIEILLSKAPTTELGHLLPWTRKVIKHEALAIRAARERTLVPPRPSQGQEDESEDWIQLIPAAGDGPDELAVRRERIARSKEALTRLKPAELKALTQLAEGFSYQEIGAMNDWTRTKVNRCLAEGRARFRSAFRESEAGARCPEFEPLISACCDGELSGPQLAELENHMAVCGHCRSTLKAFRAAPKAAAALAPLLPGGSGFWERIQLVAIDLQNRINGIGRGSESGLQTVLASGGTRGAGVAAIAKLTALCAGTAGTAAVCVAAGVLPAPAILPREDDRQTVRKDASAPDPESVRPLLDIPERTPAEPPEGKPQPEKSAAEKAGSAKESSAAEPAVATPPPAPPPTATESEFTPEAAGTPAPAAPPPPQKPSRQVPVSNGGGEFAP